MKYIYITMMQLPTITNKYVSFITGFEYTHFSVSFDEKMEKLYSFQVKNKSIPFVGGFMEESHASFFHGKNNISLKEKVFKVPVNKVEYQKILTFIENIKNDNEYMFNYVSALLMFLIGGIKSYKSYHCVEFVSNVVNFIDNIQLPKEIHKMHPRDLYIVLNPYLYIERIINSDDFENENDIFNKKIKLNIAIKKSIYSIKESICRAILNRITKNFNYKNINFYYEDIAEK